MEVKPGYKLTEVGVIPEEWEVQRLGGAGHWFSGGTPSMANDVYWNGEIPWVSAKDMKVSRIRDSLLHVTEKAIGNGTRIAQTGAVLLVVRGMILAHTLPVAVATRPVAFNQDMKALITRAGVDNEFILVWLQANARNVLGIASESTHGTKRFASDDLFSMKVALPPLPEQRAIAAALSDVDGLLGALDRLIAKKRDLKQAAMQQLLTGQTRLPGFHGEWEVKRLGDVASVSKGTQLHSSETDEGGKFAHLNGGITPSSYTHKSNTDGNTIAISEGGNSCGFVQFMTEPYWCGGHCYSVIPNVVDNQFLYHALKGQQSAIMGLRVGSGLPNVQKTGLLDFKIELPTTLPEQTAIATVLSEMDGELAVLEQRREKTRALKQAMMQELLTGRTRLV